MILTGNAIMEEVERGADRHRSVRSGQRKPEQLQFHARADAQSLSRDDARHAQRKPDRRYRDGGRIDRARAGAGSISLTAGSVSAAPNSCPLMPLRSSVARLGMFINLSAPLRRYRLSRPVDDPALRAAPDTALRGYGHRANDVLAHERQHHALRGQVPGGQGSDLLADLSRRGTPPSRWRLRWRTRRSDGRYSSQIRQSETGGGDRAGAGKRCCWTRVSFASLSPITTRWRGRSPRSWKRSR